MLQYKKLELLKVYQEITQQYYLSAIGLGLLLTTPLLKLHLSHVHDTGGELVHVLYFRFVEAQNVKSVLK